MDWVSFSKDLLPTILSCLTLFGSIFGAGYNFTKSFKKQFQELEVRLDAKFEKLDVKIEALNAKQDAASARHEQRIDQLYQMFVDLLKKGKK